MQRVAKLVDALELIKSEELKAVQASARKYLEPHRGSGARIFNQIDAELLVDKDYFTVWSDFYANLTTSFDDHNWHQHPETLGKDPLEILSKVFPKDKEQKTAAVNTFENNYKGIQKFLDQIIEVGCDKALDKYGYLDITWTEKLGVTDLITKPDDIEQILAIIGSYKEAIFSLLDKARTEKNKLTAEQDIVYNILTYFRGYYEKHLIFAKLEQLIAKRHALLIRDFLAKVAVVELTVKEHELNQWIADQLMMDHDGSRSPIEILAFAAQKCEYMKLKDSALATILNDFLKAYPVRSLRFTVSPIPSLSPSLSSSDVSSPLDLRSPSSQDSSSPDDFSSDSDSDKPVQRVLSEPTSHRPLSLQPEKAEVKGKPPTKRTPSLPTQSTKPKFASFFHRAAADSVKVPETGKKKEIEFSKKLEMYKSRMQLWLANKTKSDPQSELEAAVQRAGAGLDF